MAWNASSSSLDLSNIKVKAVTVIFARFHLAIACIAVTVICASIHLAVSAVAFTVIFASGHIAVSAVAFTASHANRHAAVSAVAFTVFHAPAAGNLSYNLHLKVTTSSWAFTILYASCGRTVPGLEHFINLGAP
eukprot:scaffold16993_cov126-Skeletonema_marinoi.AAC.1